MIECGMAEVVITPPLGSAIPGGGSERLSTGVKDDLFVKAMVLETEREMYAFVVIDAIDVRREDVESIRRKAAASFGIPAGHIMVSATHTHTSGPTIVTSYVKALDEAYTNDMVNKSVDAISVALAKKTKVRIGFGLGEVEGISFNRRFHMKDGTVKTNPGVGNPDVIKPTGPIDPDFPVMRIEELNGKPIGFVTTYACHADTIGGTEYSGDFPGALSRKLKAMYGEHVVSLFYQGTSGNINHVDVQGASSNDRATHYETMGTILAEEAVKLSQSIKPADKLSIRSKAAWLPMTLRKPKAEELSAANEVLQAKEQYPATEVNFAKQALELADLEPTKLEVEIQVVAFGEQVAMVFLPAEMFVEFGLKIKALSSFPLTIVNELSNGSISGYICTREAYNQGGYENRIRGYSRAPIDAGDQFVQEALALLADLKS